MLYVFHAILIAAGILLAAGMAARELLVTEGPWAGDPLRAIVLAALAAALGIYLFVFIRRRRRESRG